MKFRPIFFHIVNSQTSQHACDQSHIRNVTYVLVTEFEGILSFDDFLPISAF